MNLARIRKRDGSLETFNPSRIYSAIFRALAECKLSRPELAKACTEKVLKILRERPGGYPDVETVQDVVEKVLMENKLPQVARAYIRYRDHRRQLRETKQLFGVTDRLKLSLSALAVLKQRYLLRKKGKVVETSEQLFHRVARHVSQAEKLFGASASEYEEKFYSMMSQLEFLPNSPTLMNAGTNPGQLSACFVLPVEDSLQGIFESLKNMALIHQSGGGTGFSFSSLRPQGDLVSSTQGIASGPLSFMEIFDAATSVVKQGGRRRGANMAILRVDHPDILEFITAKRTQRFSNFNLSVSVTDAFMKKVLARDSYPLINPRTKRPTRKLPAVEVFEMMAQSAWETGEPGLIFIDTINRANPTPSLGPIEACNPCGEQPLLPYESCNLGSINLSKVVEKGRVDWEKLKNLVHLGVRFLDDVLEVNQFPLAQVAEKTMANRKIGLGVMGWADALVKLGISYGSVQSFQLAEKIMRFINREAFRYSSYLGEKRGSFPNLSLSIYHGKIQFLRHATRTTIAPTGTISIIAGCSSGIEPYFGLAFVRRILSHQTFLEVNSFLEQEARKAGIMSPSFLRQLINQGSLARIPGVPKRLRRLFVTAFDLTGTQHLRMQAAFQKYTDNAVSKTVNLPEEATVGEIKRIFLLAWKLKCKGITVFRYGSRKQQVLYHGQDVESLEWLAGEEMSCLKNTCEF